MLTARDAEVDRVLGLELGADDYVTKPFSIAELVSRVRAMLRRRELDRGRGRRRRAAVGGLRIDLARHEVHVDGEPVRLTPSEFKLLALLAEEPERVFTRRQIMEHLWESDVRRRRARLRRPHLEPAPQDRARSRAPASGS